MDVTAGQWFWLMNRADKQPQGILPSDDPTVTVVANQPVKFIAHSIDVNHGFGIFAGSSDGAPILLQMQVIPKIENVFYYTFRAWNILYKMSRILWICTSLHDIEDKSYFSNTLTTNIKKLAL